jgi:hypothetical protein
MNNNKRRRYFGRRYFGPHHILASSLDYCIFLAQKTTKLIY